MITIYDIAKYCNVAPGTVSKVINNYPNVSEKTKEKVLKALDELHYLPNTLAKSLGSGKSYNVGVLMYTGEGTPFFKQNLFIDILESIRHYLESQNYDLLLVSKNVAGKSETYLDHCYARHIDGLVFFGDFTSPAMQDLIRSDIPTVGFDYVGNAISGVFSDNYEKMTLLIEHLIELGHRDIIFIHGEDNEITKARIKAFQDTLVRHRIGFDPAMLVQGQYCDINGMHDKTLEILSRPHRPTAIMYPDDYAAIGGKNAAYELNLSVPVDLSITGFDGITIGQVERPKLTTIRQDTQKIGEALAKKLLGIITKENAGQELICVEGEFIVGETTWFPTTRREG